jgi:hypothetical protein
MLRATENEKATQSMASVCSFAYADAFPIFGVGDWSSVEFSPPPRFVIVRQSRAEHHLSLVSQLS